MMRRRNFEAKIEATRILKAERIGRWGSGESARHRRRRAAAVEGRGWNESAWGGGTSAKISLFAKT